MACTGAAQRAATNSLMTNHFPSHIQYVVASATLETAAFTVEFFYVQKGRSPETGAWETAPFGFFDFHVHSVHPDADFDGILGATEEQVRSRTTNQFPISHHVRSFLVFDLA